MCSPKDVGFLCSLFLSLPSPPSLPSLFFLLPLLSLSSRTKMLMSVQSLTATAQGCASTHQGATTVRATLHMGKSSSQMVEGALVSHNHFFLKPTHTALWTQKFNSLNQLNVKLVNSNFPYTEIVFYNEWQCVTWICLIYIPVSCTLYVSLPKWTIVLVNGTSSNMVVWRFAIIRPLEPSVMTSGMSLMLQWSAGS